MTPCLTSVSPEAGPPLWEPVGSRCLLVNNFVARQGGPANLQLPGEHAMLLGPLLDAYGRLLQISLHAWDFCHWCACPAVLLQLDLQGKLLTSSELEKQITMLHERVH